MKRMMATLFTGLGLCNAVVSADTISMEHCIRRGLAKSVTVETAKNSNEISRIKQRETMANLLPKISAVGDYRYYIDQPTQLMPMSMFNGPEGKFREAEFGVPHTINGSIQLAVPLYSPQLYGAIHSAESSRELSSLQLKQAREQIVMDITGLYYNGQLLKQHLSFLDSSISGTDKLIEITARLQEQALARTTDLTKVELQRIQLLVQKASTTAKYQQVLSSLKLLMAIEQDSNITLSDSIAYYEPSVYRARPTTEVKMIETKSKLISAELRTLKTSRIPTISMYGSLGTIGYGYDKEPNEFLKWFPVNFVGIQASVPLFDGTVLHQKIAQKQLELKNSELLSEQATIQNRVQIRNADNQRNSAVKLIKLCEKQIELATKNLENCRLLYQQGVASLADQLTADSALREAQQNWTGAVIDYSKADLELKRLTGSLALDEME